MSERIFPIMESHYDGYERRKDLKAIRDAGHCIMVIGIPWDLMAQHEEQCLRNHSQTVQRLSERGGLIASEAVAVLEDRRFTSMAEAAAQARLLEIVDDYARTVQAAPSEDLSQKLKLTEEELDEVQGKLDDSEEFSSACLALILRHVGEAELEDDDFVSITDLEQAIMRHEAAPSDRETMLEEALRPFAGLDIRMYSAASDDTEIFGMNDSRIHVGDVRRARAALAAASDKPQVSPCDSCKHKDLSMDTGCSADPSKDTCPKNQHDALAQTNKENNHE